MRTLLPEPDSDHADELVEGGEVKLGDLDAEVVDTHSAARGKVGAVDVVFLNSADSHNKASLSFL